MPDLDYAIEGVDAVPYAASPQLAFKLRINQALLEGEAAVSIHSVMLRCQIRLEPTQRRYLPGEQKRLHELFGEPHRYGQTVRSTLWQNVTLSVPPFQGETRLDLIAPCTYDFNIAATKYFAALETDEVPLSFLFSGTIFYATGDQGLQVEQISWEKEAAFRLPVSIWRQMMDLYYPNAAWLCLRQDLFDRLNQYRVDRAMLTWEEAIESLFSAAEVPQ